jgi:acetyl-CoA acetyltransferase
MTAGNASGIVDGGAALILASRDAVDRHQLQPIGRMLAWASTGVDPSLMGMGPAPASRKALAQIGLSLDDIDFVEVYEAFAKF